MNITQVLDILEIIRDNGGRDMALEEAILPRYGANGTRITPAGARKVLGALNKRDVRSLPIEDIIAWLYKEIREGKNTVYLMKHHWEARRREK